MAQRGRRDIDQRARLPPHPGLEAAALDNQERPLLVRAEPAMLAEADLALAVRGILHDRRVAGQAGPGQPLADEQLADPVLAREKTRDPRYQIAFRLGEIEGRGGAV